MIHSAQVEQFYKDKKGMDTYKGIQMFAVSGLHEELARIAKNDLPEKSRILDVGCGRGALSLRLHDHGFRVDACDMVDQCECKETVNFVHLKAEDLELDVLYDAIFIVEVIEHVEDPFSIIRKYAKYLKPTGILYVTSPSTDSLFSRTWFYLTGRHWYFEDDNVRNDGHIMPIHKFQMSYLAGELEMNLGISDCKENRKVGFSSFGILLFFLELYLKFKKLFIVTGPVTIYRFSKEK